MILKDISFDDPLKNILFDDVLLQMAERGEGGEVLRFWESPKPFVVLGLVGKVDEDVNLDSARQDGIPVLRRSSGGGTVLQGPGSLNYTLVLSKDIRPDIADLRKSYHYILSRICESLAMLKVQAEFLPISDIALSENRKKISGNAQKRGKNYILHHGTLLYNLDISLVSKYLRMPKSIPEYRKDRSHADFVTNICAEREALKKVVCRVFGITSPAEALTQREMDFLDISLQLSGEKVISL